MFIRILLYLKPPDSQVDKCLLELLVIARYCQAFVLVFGIQKAINRAAIKASEPPKKNGADAPNPGQLPAPCQSSPAMSEAGECQQTDDGIIGAIGCSAQFFGDQIGHHGIGRSISHAIINP